MLLRISPNAHYQTIYSLFKANFLSVESSERTGNLLFTRESVALNLNKMLRVTDLSLCKFPSGLKILLSGNQPLQIL